MSDYPDAVMAEMEERRLDGQLDEMFDAEREDRKIVALVNVIKESAVLLSKLTPSDEALADAVGRTREAEVSLQQTRLRWERLTAEMEPISQVRGRSDRVDPNERTSRSAAVAVGQQYELVPQFTNDYSFNTPAILMAGTRDGVGPMDVLMDAIGQGAATLKWTITKLQQFASERQMVLTIGPEAVSDHDGLDAPMVGKVRRQSGVKRIALKGEPV